MPAATRRFHVIPGGTDYLDGPRLANTGWGLAMRRAQPTTSTGETFDDVVLPHLDAGYRLARWLLRNEADAEDVVQEASLRAWRYFRTFSGGNGRAWFLKIVRNACSTLYRRTARTPTDLFDEEQHTRDQLTFDSETLLMQADNRMLINQVMNHLPTRFRELLVLRELEGLSYQELAEVLDIPIGTVMSGLSRARQAFRGALAEQLEDTPAAGAASSSIRHCAAAP